MVWWENRYWGVVVVVVVVGMRMGVFMVLVVIVVIWIEKVLVLVLWFLKTHSIWAVILIWVSSYFDPFEEDLTVAGVYVWFIFDYLEEFLLVLFELLENWNEGVYDVWLLVLLLKEFFFTEIWEKRDLFSVVFDWLLHFLLKIVFFEIFWVFSYWFLSYILRK